MEKKPDYYSWEYVPMILLPNDYLYQIIHWHEQRGDQHFEHIVECECMIPDPSQWLQHQVPMVECYILKIRDDKHQPNDQKTIITCLKSIQENISIKDISLHCL